MVHDHEKQKRVQTFIIHNIKSYHVYQLVNLQKNYIIILIQEIRSKYQMKQLRNEVITNIRVRGLSLSISVAARRMEKFVGGMQDHLVIQNLHGEGGCGSNSRKSPHQHLWSMKTFLFSFLRCFLPSFFFLYHFIISPFDY